MKAIALFAAACATAVFADPGQVKPRALYTIETAPGRTVQITEEERWELSSVCDMLS
jgi:leucyl aminopeptidase